MNPTLFFENFELLADSPNGVQKLRELILQLAVMGKLVPQDPNDEPASVLLERIEAEKKRLVKESTLKNNELLPSVEKNEIKFEVTQSWEWVRLGEVINYNGAQKVSSEDIPDDAWLIDLEDIEKNTSKIINYVQFKDKKSKSTKAKFNKGDVLYGKLRPYLNKVVVAEENGYCTTEIVPLSIYTGIDPYYLMYSLKRPDFLEYVNSKTYGTKMPRLGTEDARKSLFPLPPIAEQKRIVSKVDELMALCDKLEARRQKKQEIQNKLNSAALDKMLSAENQEEFEQNWRRICENFDLLYDNPENVEKLKQAIIQLAVQGKLVPQNPEDEPASFLIEKIKAERERLIKKGEIKKNKSISLIEIEEIPNELPKGWTLEYLGNIVLDFQNGTSKRDSSTGGPIPVLRLADIKNGKLCEDSVREINLTEQEALKYGVDKGDILVIRVNGSENLVGRFVPCMVDREWAYCDHLIRVKLPANYIDQSYLRTYAESFEARSHILQKTITTAGQKTINQVGLGLLPVLIPPLEEQKRIVSKVEQFMSLCDKLELKLRKEREESEKLMETVVKRLLEGVMA